MGKVIFFLCVLSWLAQGQHPVFIDEEVYLIVESYNLDGEPHRAFTIVREQNDLLDSVKLRNSHITFDRGVVTLRPTVSCEQSLKRTSYIIVKTEAWLNVPRYLVAAPDWRVVDSVIPDSIPPYLLTMVIDARHTRFTQKTGPFDERLIVDSINKAPASKFIRNYLDTAKTLGLDYRLVKDTLPELGVFSHYAVTPMPYPNYHNIELELGGSNPEIDIGEEEIMLTAFKVRVKGALIAVGEISFPIWEKSLAYGYRHVGIQKEYLNPDFTIPVESLFPKKNGKFWFFEIWDWNPIESASYYGH